MSIKKTKSMLIKLTKVSDEKLASLSDEQIKQIRSVIDQIIVKDQSIGPSTFTKLSMLSLKLMLSRSKEALP